MTQEELQVQQALEAKMLEATKGLATTESLEAVKSEMVSKSEVKTEIESLKDILATQGEEINSLKEAPKAEHKQMNFIDSTIAILKDNEQGYKDFKDKKTPLVIEYSKAAGTMTIGTNVTGATTLLPTPQVLAGYNPYRWNPATFWDYANKRTTNSARISYVDEVSPDGTPATTAEGSAKPAIDVDYKVSTSSAIKVPAVLKVSDEMLEDINFMADAIGNNLVDRVRLAVSGNIYSYIVSNAGLTAVSSTMADMGGSAPTMWQLISAAKETIRKSNHNCTHVFLNPTDYARMILTKGDTNIAIQVGISETMVHGVMVVPSNAVAVDKYIACDMSKLNVYEYKALTVTMGWENDDFTKNLRTFLGETRVHYFIKDNDKTAFLYGDVTDDLTTLTV